MKFRRYLILISCSLFILFPCHSNSEEETYEYYTVTDVHIPGEQLKLQDENATTETVIEQYEYFTEAPSVSHVSRRITGKSSKIKIRLDKGISISFDPDLNINSGDQLKTKLKILRNQSQNVIGSKKSKIHISMKSFGSEIESKPTEYEEFVEETYQKPKISIRLTDRGEQDYEEYSNSDFFSSGGRSGKISISLSGTSKKHLKPDQWQSNMEASADQTFQSDGDAELANYHIKMKNIMQKEILGSGKVKKVKMVKNSQTDNSMIDSIDSSLNGSAGNDNKNFTYKLNESSVQDNVGYGQLSDDLLMETIQDIMKQQDSTGNLKKKSQQQKNYRISIIEENRGEEGAGKKRFHKVGSQIERTKHDNADFEDAELQESSIDNSPRNRTSVQNMQSDFQSENYDASMDTEWKKKSKTLDRPIRIQIDNGPQIDSNKQNFVVRKNTDGNEEVHYYYYDETIPGQKIKISLGDSSSSSSYRYKNGIEYETDSGKNGFRAMGKSKNLNMRKIVQEKQKSRNQIENQNEPQNLNIFQTKSDQDEERGFHFSKIYLGGPSDDNLEISSSGTAISEGVGQQKNITRKKKKKKLITIELESWDEEDDEEDMVALQRYKNMRMKEKTSTNGIKKGTAHKVKKVHSSYDAVPDNYDEENLLITGKVKHKKVTLQNGDYDEERQREKIKTVLNGEDNNQQTNPQRKSYPNLEEASPTPESGIEPKMQSQSKKPTKSQISSKQPKKVNKQVSEDEYYIYIDYDEVSKQKRKQKIKKSKAAATNVKWHKSKPNTLLNSVDLTQTSKIPQYATTANESVITMASSVKESYIVLATEKPPTMNPAYIPELKKKSKDRKNITSEVDMDEQFDEESKRKQVTSFPHSSSKAFDYRTKQQDEDEYYIEIDTDSGKKNKIKGKKSGPRAMKTLSKISEVTTKVPSETMAELKVTQASSIASNQVTVQQSSAATQSTVTISFETAKVTQNPTRTAKTIEETSNNVNFFTTNGSQESKQIQGSPTTPVTPQKNEQPALFEKQPKTAIKHKVKQVTNIPMIDNNSDIEYEYEIIMDMGKPSKRKIKRIVKKSKPIQIVSMETSTKSLEITKHTPVRSEEDANIIQALVTAKEIAPAKQMATTLQSLQEKYGKEVNTTEKSSISDDMIKLKGKSKKKINVSIELETEKMKSKKTLQKTSPIRTTTVSKLKISQQQPAEGKPEMVTKQQTGQWETSEPDVKPSRPIPSSGAFKLPVRQLLQKAVMTKSRFKSVQSTVAKTISKSLGITKQMYDIDTENARTSANLKPTTTKINVVEPSAKEVIDTINVKKIQNLVTDEVDRVNIIDGSKKTEQLLIKQKTSPTSRASFAVTQSSTLAKDRKKVMSKQQYEMKKITKGKNNRTIEQEVYDESVRKTQTSILDDGVTPITKSSTTKGIMETSSGASEPVTKKAAGLTIFEEKPEKNINLNSKNGITDRQPAEPKKDERSPILQQPSTTLLMITQEPVGEKQQTITIKFEKDQYKNVWKNAKTRKTISEKDLGMSSKKKTEPYAKSFNSIQSDGSITMGKFVRMTTRIPGMTAGSAAERLAKETIFKVEESTQSLDAGMRKKSSDIITKVPDTILKDTSIMKAVNEKDKKVPETTSTKINNIFLRITSKRPKGISGGTRKAQVRAQVHEGNFTIHKPKPMQAIIKTSNESMTITELTKKEMEQAAKFTKELQLANQSTTSVSTIAETSNIGISITKTVKEKFVATTKLWHKNQTGIKTKRTMTNLSKSMQSKGVHIIDKSNGITKRMMTDQTHEKLIGHAALQPKEITMGYQEVTTSQSSYKLSPEPAQDYSKNFTQPQPKTLIGVNIHPKKEMKSIIKSSSSTRSISNVSRKLAKQKAVSTKLAQTELHSMATTAANMKMSQKPAIRVTLSDVKPKSASEVPVEGIKTAPILENQQRVTVNSGKEPLIEISQRTSESLPVNGTTTTIEGKTTAAMPNSTLRIIQRLTGKFKGAAKVTQTVKSAKKVVATLQPVRSSQSSVKANKIPINGTSGGVKHHITKFSLKKTTSSTGETSSKLASKPEFTMNKSTEIIVAATESAPKSSTTPEKFGQGIIQLGKSTAQPKKIILGAGKASIKIQKKTRTTGPISINLQSRKPASRVTLSVEKPAPASEVPVGSIKTAPIQENQQQATTNAGKEPLIRMSPRTSESLPFDGTRPTIEGKTTAVMPNSTLRIIQRFTGKFKGAAKVTQAVKSAKKVVATLQPVRSSQSSVKANKIPINGTSGGVKHHITKLSLKKTTSSTGETSPKLAMSLKLASKPEFTMNKSTETIVAATESAPKSSTTPEKFGQGIIKLGKSTAQPKKIILGAGKASIKIQKKTRTTGPISINQQSQKPAIRVTLSDVKPKSASENPVEGIKTAPILENQQRVTVNSGKEPLIEISQRTSELLPVNGTRTTIEGKTTAAMPNSTLRIIQRFTGKFKGAAKVTQALKSAKKVVATLQPVRSSQSSVKANKIPINGTSGGVKHHITKLSLKKITSSTGDTSRKLAMSLKLASKPEFTMNKSTETIVAATESAPKSYTIPEKFGQDMKVSQHTGIIKLGKSTAQPKKIILGAGKTSIKIQKKTRTTGPISINQQSRKPASGVTLSVEKPAPASEVPVGSIKTAPIQENQQQATTNAGKEPLIRMSPRTSESLPFDGTRPTIEGKTTAVMPNSTLRIIQRFTGKFKGAAKVTQAVKSAKEVVATLQPVRSSQSSVKANKIPINGTSGGVKHHITKLSLKKTTSSTGDTSRKLAMSLKLASKPEFTMNKTTETIVAATESALKSSTTPEKFGQGIIKLGKSTAQPKKIILGAGKASIKIQKKTRTTGPISINKQSQKPASGVTLSVEKPAPASEVPVGSIKTAPIQENQQQPTINAGKEPLIRMSPRTSESLPFDGTRPTIEGKTTAVMPNSTLRIIQRFTGKFKGAAKVTQALKSAKKVVATLQPARSSQSSVKANKIPINGTSGGVKHHITKLSLKKTTSSTGETSPKLATSMKLASKPEFTMNKSTETIVAATESAPKSYTKPEKFGQDMKVSQHTGIIKLGKSTAQPKKIILGAGKTSIKIQKKTRTTGLISINQQSRKPASGVTLSVEKPAPASEVPVGSIKTAPIQENQQQLTINAGKEPLIRMSPRTSESLPFDGTRPTIEGKTTAVMPNSTLRIIQRFTGKFKGAARVTQALKSAKKVVATLQPARSSQSSVKANKIPINGTSGGVKHHITKLSLKKTTSSTGQTSPKLAMSLKLASKPEFTMNKSTETIVAATESAPKSYTKPEKFGQGIIKLGKSTAQPKKIILGAGKTSIKIQKKTRTTGLISINQQSRKPASGVTLSDEKPAPASEVPVGSIKTAPIQENQQQPTINAGKEPLIRMSPRTSESLPFDGARRTIEGKTTAVMPNSTLRIIQRFTGKFKGAAKVTQAVKSAKKVVATLQPVRSSQSSVKANKIPINGTSGGVKHHITKLSLKKTTSSTGETSPKFAMSLKLASKPEFTMNKSTETIVAATESAPKSSTTPEKFGQGIIKLGKSTAQPKKIILGAGKASIKIQKKTRTTGLISINQQSRKPAIRVTLSDVKPKSASEVPVEGIKTAPILENQQRVTVNSGKEPLIEISQRTSESLPVNGTRTTIEGKTTAAMPNSTLRIIQRFTGKFKGAAKVTQTVKSAKKVVATLQPVRSSQSSVKANKIPINGTSGGVKHHITKFSLKKTTSSTGEITQKLPVSLKSASEADFKTNKSTESLIAATVSTLGSSKASAIVGQNVKVSQPASVIKVKKTTLQVKKISLGIGKTFSRIEKQLGTSTSTGDQQSQQSNGVTLYAKLASTSGVPTAGVEKEALRKISQSLNALLPGNGTKATMKNAEPMLKSSSRTIQRLPGKFTGDARVTQTMKASRKALGSQKSLKTTKSSLNFTNMVDQTAGGNASTTVKLVTKSGVSVESTSESVFKMNKSTGNKIIKSTVKFSKAPKFGQYLKASQRVGIIKSERTTLQLKKVTLGTGKTFDKTERQMSTSTAGTVDQQSQTSTRLTLSYAKPASASEVPTASVGKEALRKISQSPNESLPDKSTKSIVENITEGMSKSSGTIQRLDKGAKVKRTAKYGKNVVVPTMQPMRSSQKSVKSTKSTANITTSTVYVLNEVNVSSPGGIQYQTVEKITPSTVKHVPKLGVSLKPSAKLDSKMKKPTVLATKYILKSSRATENYGQNVKFSQPMGMIKVEKTTLEPAQSTQGVQSPLISVDQQSQKSVSGFTQSNAESMKTTMQQEKQPNFTAAVGERRSRRPAAADDSMKRLDSKVLKSTQPYNTTAKSAATSSGFIGENAEKAAEDAKVERSNSVKGSDRKNEQYTTVYKVQKSVSTSGIPPKIIAKEQKALEVGSALQDVEYGGSNKTTETPQKKTGVTAESGKVDKPVSNVPQSITVAQGYDIKPKIPEKSVKIGAQETLGTGAVPETARITKNAASDKPPVIPTEGMKSGFKASESTTAAKAYEMRSKTPEKVVKIGAQGTLGTGAVPETPRITKNAASDKRTVRPRGSIKPGSKVSPTVAEPYDMRSKTPEKSVKMGAEEILATRTVSDIARSTKNAASDKPTVIPTAGIKQGFKASESTITAAKAYDMRSKTPEKIVKIGAQGTLGTGAVPETARITKNAASDKRTVRPRGSIKPGSKVSATVAEPYDMKSKTPEKSVKIGAEEILATRTVSDIARSTKNAASDKRTVRPRGSIKPGSKVSPTVAEPYDMRSKTPEKSVKIGAQKILATRAITETARSTKNVAKVTVRPRASIEPDYKVSKFTTAGTAYDIRSKIPQKSVKIGAQEALANTNSPENVATDKVTIFPKASLTINMSQESKAPINVESGSISTTLSASKSQNDTTIIEIPATDSEGVVEKSTSTSKPCDVNNTTAAKCEQPESKPCEKSQQKNVKIIFEEEPLEISLVKLIPQIEIVDHRVDNRSADDKKPKENEAGVPRDENKSTVDQKAKKNESLSSYPGIEILIKKGKVKIVEKPQNVHIQIDSNLQNPKILGMSMDPQSKKVILPRLQYANYPEKDKECDNKKIKSQNVIETDDNQQHQERIKRSSDSAQVLDSKMQTTPKNGMVSFGVQTKDQAREAQRSKVPEKGAKSGHDKAMPQG